MKRILLQEGLIWKALRDGSSSEFDVLWEILQSPNVQGYITAEDLGTLYGRIAREQDVGIALALMGRFCRVLEVYPGSQDCTLDAAIAEHEAPWIETENGSIPVLSIHSFLKRYALYELYITNRQAFQLEGWYRKWRSSGFDPLLVIPLVLTLIIQNLPAFEQLLADLLGQPQSKPNPFGPSTRQNIAAIQETPLANTIAPNESPSSPTAPSWDASQNNPANTKEGSRVSPQTNLLGHLATSLGARLGVLQPTPHSNYVAIQRGSSPASPRQESAHTQTSTDRAQTGSSEAPETIIAYAAPSRREAPAPSANEPQTREEASSSSTNFGTSGSRGYTDRQIDPQVPPSVVGNTVDQELPESSNGPEMEVFEQPGFPNFGRGKAPSERPDGNAEGNGNGNSNGGEGNGNGGYNGTPEGNGRCGGDLEEPPAEGETPPSGSTNEGGRQNDEDTGSSPDSKEPNAKEPVGEGKDFSDVVQGFCSDRTDHADPLLGTTGVNFDALENSQLSVTDPYGLDENLYSFTSLIVLEEASTPIQTTSIEDIFPVHGAINFTSSDLSTYPSMDWSDFNACTDAHFTPKQSMF